MAQISPNGPRRNPLLRAKIVAAPSGGNLRPIAGRSRDIEIPVDDAFRRSQVGQDDPRDGRTGCVALHSTWKASRIRAVNPGPWLCDGGPYLATTLLPADELPDNSRLRLAIFADIDGISPRVATPLYPPGDWPLHG